MSDDIPCEVEVCQLTARSSQEAESFVGDVVASAQRKVREVRAVRCQAQQDAIGNGENPVQLQPSELRQAPEEACHALISYSAKAISSRQAILW